MSVTSLTEGSSSLQVLEPSPRRSRSGKWDPAPGISQDQAQAIVDAAPSPRDQLLIRTLFAAGVRVGELVRLRPVDIVDGRTLRFPLEKNPSRHWNDVVLWPDDRALIADLLLWCKAHRLNDEEPVFSGRYRGKPITRQAVGRIFTDAARQAGVFVFEEGRSIPAHPHTARHSATRWDLARGMALPAIQRQRGWSRLASGEGYLQPDPAQVVSMMERLSRTSPTSA